MARTMNYTNFPMRTLGILMAALLIAVAIALGSSTSASAQDILFEEYFIPLPEEDISDSFETINSDNNGNINTRITIAIGADTVIYYDQAENGYDADLANPGNLYNAGGGCGSANLGGTQIWGNNDPCDGIPPGFATDLLSNGDVIVLESSVPVNPRDPSLILFDGGDRFASTTNVGVVRTAYPDTPGSPMSGAVEVFDTNRWGTEYQAPVGEDTSSVTNAWQYTALYVMAGYNFTDIYFNGAVIPLTSLNAGQNLVVHVNEGDIVTSTLPIQVHIVSGDIGSAYEMRWDSLLPRSEWRSFYSMPVGAPVSNEGLINEDGEAAVWFFNPNPSDIVIFGQIGDASTSTTVPAGQAVMGPHVGGALGNEGGRFSSGGTFYAFAQLDANGSGEDAAWSFPLLQDTYSQALVSNGLACTAPGATVLGDTCPSTTTARSYVWTMLPFSSGSLYVDYDGGPAECPPISPDETLFLDELEIVKVTPPSDDLDATGTRIWSCDSAFVAAWGQDPAKPTPDDHQALTMGTAIYSILPLYSEEKYTTLMTDNDGDGVISPGDVITYTIVVRNNHNQQTSYANFIGDTLSSLVTYVPDTTFYDNGATTEQIPDDGGGSTPFPLDEGGLDTFSVFGGSIPFDPGETFTVYFRVIVNQGRDDCSEPLYNSAYLNVRPEFCECSFDINVVEVTVLACNPGIDIEKFTNGEDVTAPTGPVLPVSADVTWNYTVTNIGDVFVENIDLVDDQEPLSCTIPSELAPGDSFTCEAGGNATEGQYTNVVTVTADTRVLGTASVTDTDQSFYLGVLPSFVVTKTADPTEIEGTGGVVTFDLSVQNTGRVTVELESLIDDLFDDVTTTANISSTTCAVPQELDAAEIYTCTFDAFVSGNEATPHHDTVTATVHDASGSKTPKTDDATVTFDQFPEITVVKSVTPALVTGTSGLVTYTVLVSNTGPVSLTLTSLTDSKFPDIDGKGSCATGGVIAVGGSYSCSFSATITGNEAAPHTNTVTAIVEDKDGNEDSDNDFATVTFDELPIIAVTKNVAPPLITGTSGSATYTVTIENIGPVSVTLTSLMDTAFNNLNGNGSCDTGVVIAVKGTYTCTFTENISGDEATPHENTVTAVARDKDGNNATDNDSATVNFDQLPTIVVTKSVAPAEINGMSGSATFTVKVENTGPVSVTLISLTDTAFGNIDGQGSCDTGGVIASLSSYTCSFTKNISGDETTPHDNTVTAVGEDKDGNQDDASDSASVVFDQLPAINVTKNPTPAGVPESGGTVTFNIVVTNLATETVRLTGLADVLQGDSTATSSSIANSTCTTDGSVILQPAGQANASYACSFQRTISGNDSQQHHNRVTATVTDNEGNQATDAADALVDITNQVPTIVVTKSANPTALLGSSGLVTFTVKVENTGPVSVTLLSLTDSKFSNLNGKGNCATGVAIAAGKSYTCSFFATVSGTESVPHQNTVTAVVADKDNDQASDNDDATVTFDELPAIKVTKSAAPASVSEPSGVVIFTVVVENLVNEPLTLTDVADEVALDSSAQSSGITNNTCLTSGPVALARAGQSGATYTCTFQRVVSGNAEQQHHNEVTATAEDNEGNEATASDDALVAITDLLPSIRVTKSADLASVTESGATVTFSVLVENLSIENATLTAINDALLGDSNAASGIITNNSCITGAQTAPLAPAGQNGDSYTCSFRRVISGEAGQQHHNEVTATAEDDEGNQATASDDATVGITDILPQISLLKTADPSSLPESGGLVTFTVVVQNLVSEDLTLTQISDQLLSDSNATSGDVTNNTCSPGVLQVNASYSCSFQRTVSGSVSQQHHNEVLATAIDNDGNQTSAGDDAIVGFTEELPQIEVTKSVTPTLVTGTSGLVTFTFVVSNTGPVSVTLVSLTDSSLDDLNLKGTCATGAGISVGASYTCTYSTIVSGNEITPHTNVVTAIARDGNGDEASDEAGATVAFDELPDIEVDKSADPSFVNGSSGPVTFTVAVTNAGNVTVTLVSLNDSVFGDLNGQGSCGTNGVIESGAAYTCVFSATLTGSEVLTHSNVITAVAQDKDGHEDTDADEANVFFNELPIIEVTFTADPTKIIGTSDEVTFTVEVSNTGPVSVTLTSLSADVVPPPNSPFSVLAFGDLNGQGSCATGGVINVGESYICAFTETITGTEVLPHMSRATGVGVDKDGSEAVDDDDAVVVFDQLPQIVLSKSANPARITGNSGQTTFTIVVENRGPVSVTLTSLTDSVFGNLAGMGNCQIDGVIASGGNYTCAFPATVTGSPSSPHRNTATGIARDKDGNEDRDNDNASVSFAALPASIGERVWFDANGNGKQDPGEANIPGVEVRLYTSGGSLVATDTTDDNGEYLFTNLSPGDYYLEFTPPPGYDFTLFDVDGNGADDEDSDPLAPIVAVSVNDGDVDGKEMEVELDTNLTYTIFYTNTDPSRAATNVVISTTVPVGTSFVVTDSDPGWSCTDADLGTSICTISFAQLDANSSGSVAFVVRLKAQDDEVPPILTLLVTLTHSSPARTQVIMLGEGANDRTVDAGLVRTEVSEQTATVQPTSLPEVDQPEERLYMYLPTVQTEE